MYKIKNNHKELPRSVSDFLKSLLSGRSVGRIRNVLNSLAIAYLKKCFTYCVSQNQGNSESMARAIENIPYHCFNMHDKCGTWCSYHENPENYAHSNIGDGFHDVTLFECLRDIFNTLASKSSLFVAGASSNTSERSNAMIVSKAPKTRPYGKDAASDIKVACAVKKKKFRRKVLHRRS